MVRSKCVCAASLARTALYIGAMSENYREVQMLSFRRNESPFLSMVISGMAGAFQSGNTSCLHFGERNFAEIETVTLAIFVDCVHVAGQWCAFGNTISRATSTDVLYA